MRYYVITRNGEFLALSLEEPYNYNIPTSSVHVFDDDVPDLNTVIWDDSTDTFIPASTTLTKLQFLTRFTLAERISIRSSTDPVVEDIMSLFDAAEFISTIDPNTIQGIQYFASVNLLTAARAQEILE